MPRPLLRCLLLLSTSFWLPTARAQTHSSPPLSAAQETLIATSLRKYEVLKPLAYHLRRQVDTLTAVNADLHRLVAYRDTAVAATTRALRGEQALLTDQTTQAKAWKGRAKGRFWTIVALVAVMIVAGTR